MTKKLQKFDFITWFFQRENFSFVFKTQLSNLHLSYYRIFFKVINLLKKGYHTFNRSERPAKKVKNLKKSKNL